MHISHYYPGSFSIDASAAPRDAVKGHSASVSPAPLNQNNNPLEKLEKRLSELENTLLSYAFIQSNKRWHQQDLRLAIKALKAEKLQIGNEIKELKDKQINPRVRLEEVETQLTKDLKEIRNLELTLSQKNFDNDPKAVSSLFELTQNRIRLLDEHFQLLEVINDQPHAKIEKEPEPMALPAPKLLNRKDLKAKKEDLRIELDYLHNILSIQLDYVVKTISISYDIFLKEKEVNEQKEQDLRAQIKQLEEEKAHIDEALMRNDPASREGKLLARALSCPAIRHLYEKVKKIETRGRIGDWIIEFVPRSEADTGAYCRAGIRTIGIAEDTDDDYALSSLVFELLNAFHTAEYDKLENYAEVGLIDRETYAKETERVEHDVLLAHRCVMREAIEKMGWSEDLEHYKYTELDFEKWWQENKNISKHIDFYRQQFDRLSKKAPEPPLLHNRYNASKR
jgi:hypothetical protein